MTLIRVREAAELLGVSDDSVRRWIDDGSLEARHDESGRKVIAGDVLAEFARANAAAAPKDPLTVASSARNRFAGLVTKVVTDKVMAQVEMQCGPFTVVSSDERGRGPRTRARAGQRRCRRRQGHHCDRRNYWRAIVKHSRLLAVFAVLSLALIGGCGSSDQGVHASSSAPSTSAAAGGKIMVFAAASLKQTFTDIGEQFKTDNPGASVEFSFAGSSDLVTQLTQGAQADVFASADTNNMDKAAQAGLLAGDPVNFASNTLTIAVAPGNPKKIASFKDLTQQGLNVVVCAPQVPCGSATQRVEQATGVTLNPVSEESSVTDVLNKVTTGEADAGLVYVTDVKGAGDKVAEVPFPEAAGAVNTYPIAVLKESKNPELARKFVDLVTGEPGQKVLSAAGFAKP